jgi:hypothetical protein
MVLPWRYLSWYDHGGTSRGTTMEVPLGMVLPWRYLLYGTTMKVPLVWYLSWYYHGGTSRHGITMEAPLVWYYHGGTSRGTTMEPPLGVVLPWRYPCKTLCGEHRYKTLLHCIFLKPNNLWQFTFIQLSPHYRRLNGAVTTSGNNR